MTRHSINALRAMTPAEQLAVIHDPAAQNVTLTYAVEFYGKQAGAHDALAAAAHLYRHPSPVVREGCVYALEDHAADPQVGDFLREWVVTEPSPGVRSALAEAQGDA